MLERLTQGQDRCANNCSRDMSSSIRLHEFRQAGIRYLSHPCKFVTEDQLEILMMVIYNHNLQTFGNFARQVVRVAVDLIAVVVDLIVVSMVMVVVVMDLDMVDSHGDAHSGSAQYGRSYGYNEKGAWGHHAT